MLRPATAANWMNCHDILIFMVDCDAHRDHDFEPCFRLQPHADVYKSYLGFLKSCQWSGTTLNKVEENFTGIKILVELNTYKSCKL